MPRSAQSDIPGDVFAGGALRLAREQTEMRLVAWPTPSATRRLGRTSPWSVFVPEFRVVHPYRPLRLPTKGKSAPGPQLAFDFFDDTFDPNPPVRLTPAQQTRKAFDGFRFSMPKPVAAVLEPFRTNQWPLLVMLRYDEGALELAQNNPALAFALAQTMRGDREMIEAMRCSRMRQRDILEMLDLPSTPQAVNLFRKIAPASVNGDNWEGLLRVIRDEVSGRKPLLSHLPAINSGVMEILLHPTASRAAGPNLLEEVSRDRSESHRGRIVHLIASTLEMQEELRVANASRSFSDVERLRKVHAEVTEQYRRRIHQLIQANRHETDRFRCPPFPGIPGKIEPLTSAEALVNEGEAQGNCVASYAVRVRQGTTFIYRVLEPERATLSIVRNTAFGEWRVGELEGKYNTDVRSETEEFVAAWLDRQRNLL